MCWIGRNIDECKLRIADKDITVQKVLAAWLNKDGRIGYYSPCCGNFQWKKGCEYKTQMKSRTKGLGCFCIEEGFHSCLKIDMYATECYSVVNNHHIYLMQSVTDDVLCEFVIPKGAQYYVNSDGMYVSDRLRFVDVIGFNDAVC